MYYHTYKKLQKEHFLLVQSQAYPLKDYLINKLKQSSRTPQIR